MIRVGVIGAGGRMGSEVCRAVEGDGDLDLAARVDRDDSLDRLTNASVQVAVEFTVPDAVKKNVLWCLEHGVHCVVGATGLKGDDLEEVRAAAEAGDANAFVAPNFAVGAVLMMAFAAAAAPHFRTAEIIERHHEKKLDAPSGTSLRTAELMNLKRLSAWDVPESKDPAPPGSRGADVDGIRIHSLRVPGSVAHQEVVLGAPGETLTIRHDSLDRSSFMPGVLLAVKKVHELPGLTVGLENLLDV